MNPDVIPPGAGLIIAAVLWGCLIADTIVRRRRG